MFSIPKICSQISEGGLGGMSKRSELPCPDHHMVTCRRGYLRDDGCAVVLGPDGGGGTLVGSGAASVTPATFCHPRRQQTGSTGGQLTAARADQRYLSDLG